MNATESHSSKQQSHLGHTPRENSLKPERLVSLDGLRGFDMFWIIGGEAIFKGLAKVFPGRVATTGVEQLEHVAWEGLHYYDVIWPLFMFMVGVSISFSTSKRKAMGVGTKALYFHAGRRAIILFLLGMIAQGNLLDFDLSKLHPCYSVLHGIGAGYLIASIVSLNFRPVGQTAVTAGFLLLYWGLLMVIPVPGFGTGVLTPSGNAAAYVDRLILGRFHYGTNTWFLSYLGFASSVLIGVLAGELFLSGRPARVKCIRLFGAGLGALVLGLVWSIWLPIIKLLWTSTFVLVAGGLSCLLMGAFYLVIDVLAFRKWAFGFVVIGTNSIAVYMAVMLFDFRHIGNIFVRSLLPRVGVWSSFVEASAAFAVLWLILFWMYRTRTFVRI